VPGLCPSVGSPGEGAQRSWAPGAVFTHEKEQRWPSEERMWRRGEGASKSSPTGVSRSAARLRTIPAG